MYLVVKEDPNLIIAGVLGATTGKYYALERRRRKLNRKRSTRLRKSSSVRRKLEEAPADDSGDSPVPSANG